MDESVDQRIERETAALELERQGEATITCGKAFLGMDLILVCFIEIGIRTGSFLFACWVALEGLLGIILVGIGMHRKSAAHRALSALEPKPGSAASTA